MNDSEPPGVRDSDPALALLRGALEAPPLSSRTLLPRIQERIRKRTQGRYFRTRYSRSIDPIPLLLLGCLLVLVLVAAVYLIIQPLVGRPSRVQLPAAPADPMAVEPAKSSAQP